MGANLCCCSSKDAAITIGIWSFVYSLASLLLFGWQTGVLNSCRAVTMAQSNLQCEWDCPCVSSVAQLGIMGWQMAAIKYERDRAANTLLPNWNTYGRFDIPSYYESYWQTPEERYYTGLFVIQCLCLIASFFLLFAAAAMIYGIHTWRKHLVWPWFPVMISSILSSLAYCIMWWCGDVRDYWLAITIIEIIVVFINIYCVVVVMVYYRRLNATTDEYEGKDRRGVRYKINRNINTHSRRDLLDSYDGIHRSPSPKQYKPLAQPYPVYPSRPYSRAGVPQTPIPLPPTQVNTPYPIDPAELQYNRGEQVKKPFEDEDPVGSWVREQNSIDRSQHSEPITLSKQVHPTTTLQHSRSVPSLHDGTLVSHRDCKHHRSSSRRRKSRSRFDYDSDSDPTTTDFTRSKSHHQQQHRSSSHRRHRSRSRFDESVTNYDSEAERERRRAKRHGSARSSRRHRRDRDDRDDRRDRDRERERERDRDRDRNLELDKKDDRRRYRDSPERSKKSSQPAEPEMPFTGGITIPQHIVIPPSSGERGPDGQIIPQKYHINSEITINYDQNGRPIQSATPQQPQYNEEPYNRRSRQQPMQIQSTF